MILYMHRTEKIVIHNDISLKLESKIVILDYSYHLSFKATKYNNSHGNPI